MFVFSLSLSLWSLLFSMALSFLLFFSVSLSTHGDVLFWRRRRCKTCRAAMRAGPSTSDLWSRLWWRKLLCAPPLAALFAHGLCWTAFIGPFSLRFFLLWSPFVWLVHVLFLGRWLTMFVSPRSRNDAPSSVFILVPPFTRRGCFYNIVPPFTRRGRFCFFFFCRVVAY